MHALPAPRSLLFVPGDRPERFGKALASGADAVIADLEDAVAADGKDRARAAVAAALAQGERLAVRINGAETAWFDADLRMCCEARPAAVVLPKAEDPAAIADAARRLGAATPLLALIETAGGLQRVHEIAAGGCVARLLFGAIDLQLDLGMDAEESELTSLRLPLVLASRLAGLPAPVDGVTTAIDDTARIEADTRRARRLGFGGKLCIHPRQVAPVNAGFLPTAAERQWAERVVRAAADAGGAAVALDGRMLDKPVIDRARAVLRELEARRQPAG